LFGFLGCVGDKHKCDGTHNYSYFQLVIREEPLVEEAFRGATNNGHMGDEEGDVGDEGDGTDDGDGEQGCFVVQSYAPELGLEGLAEEVLFSGSQPANHCLSNYHDHTQ
jgi:hypothetical protein